MNGLIGHLEIRSERKSPIPITETGYRSHFTHAEDLEANGGVEAFINAWIKQEEKSNDDPRQGSLFL